MNFPKEVLQASRKPAIVADAAYQIITSNSREVTGNFFIDEELLKSRGVKDFSQYALNPDMQLVKDLFLD